jgi:dTDP-4-dehydrorhamnose 3,5-epimerase
VEFSPLSVPDARLIQPRVFADERGAFLEAFRADRLAAATGRTMPILQANTSVSARGVVRGIHFAEVPPGQAKYVSVAHGAVVDYVVDLRLGSPTFGAWDSAELSSDNRTALFVPEGFGHAFVALSDGTVVTYLVTDVFRPEREHGVTPLDDDIALEFPFPRDELVISPKDRAAPTLREAQDAGLLSTWEACQARYRELAS